MPEAIISLTVHKTKSKKFIERIVVNLPIETLKDMDKLRNALTYMEPTGRSTGDGRSHVNSVRRPSIIEREVMTKHNLDRLWDWFVDSVQIADLAAPDSQEFDRGL